MEACDEVGEQEKAAALSGDGLAETQQTNPNKNQWQKLEPMDSFLQKQYPGQGTRIERLGLVFLSPIV
jgi:hypothetical protein